MKPPNRRSVLAITLADRAICVVAARDVRCEDSPMAERVEFSDGREFGCIECGDPEGFPLLYLHGAPGSRLEAGPRGPFADQLKDASVRLVGMDRAGYGVSPAG